MAPKGGLDNGGIVVHETRSVTGLLQALQDVTSCEGFEDLAQRNHARDRRTLYRWRRQLGSSLQVVPSFALERLGLAHLHLVITNPGEEWFGFPYATEHAWLTDDFVGNRLYLHCIAPLAHKAAIRALVRGCQTAGWCTSISVLWSGTGWQELPDVTATSPPLDVPTSVDAVVLRDCPLIVPTIFEAWDGPASLAGIWAGIRGHVGDRLRLFVPRGRIYLVNGKTHVRQAYDCLSERGLFRQYLVRYDGWLAESLEVFVFLRRARDWVPEFSEAVRPVAVAIETYSADEESAVVRIIGGQALVRTVLGLQDDLRQHGARVCVRNPRPGVLGRVRFCYEFLFDPKAGTWVFPHDQIIAHMRGAA